jgi:hypothetical protein
MLMGSSGLDGTRKHPPAIQAPPKRTTTSSAAAGSQPIWKILLFIMPVM